jgi:hypothetical protein
VASGIERNLSLKLTQLGLSIDRATSLDNLRRIIRGEHSMLEITGVRLEQLQAISAADLEAEGGMWRGGTSKPVVEADREGFARWWSEINAARGNRWAHNPWVWVVEFRRVDRE